MAQWGPRKLGEVHEACPVGGGVLVYEFRDQYVGESTGGVRGLPVQEQAIAHLRCDACGALYGSKRRGQLLSEYCQRRLKDCRSPPEKPTTCPCCPKDKGLLVEVYLNSPRDHFSVNVEKHGTDCVLCRRCGRLLWFRDYGAEEFERQLAAFAKPPTTDPK